MSGQIPNPAIRALVVDDSSSLRRLFEELLRERGYDVSVAESGEEAVRLHLERSFELLLVDWTLPGMSGLEVCREVRSIDPGIQGLILTSYEDDEALFAAIMAGAAGYVLKQIRGTDLVDTIRRVVRTVLLSTAQ